MVTKEEMDRRSFDETNEINSSYHVTAKEIYNRFVDYDLPDLLVSVIGNYCKEHGIQKKYETVSELCEMNIKTLKTTISGKAIVTREFLYKLSVGLKMLIEDANRLFVKCGGELNEMNRGDYICMRALTDGDEIGHFIDQYNQFSNSARPMKKTTK